QMVDSIAPLLQGSGGELVDFGEWYRWLRAGCTQPPVKAPAEATVVSIPAVAQCQHAILQGLQGRALMPGPAPEQCCIVRCFAFAIGADDKQGTAVATQVVQRQVIERQQHRSLAIVPGGQCELLGDLPGSAGLAGIGDQPFR